MAGMFFCRGGVVPPVVAPPVVTALICTLTSSVFGIAVTGQTALYVPPAGTVTVLPV